MKNKVVAFFKKNTGRQFKSKEIAKRLNIKYEHDYSALKSVLSSLYKEGFLNKSGKRYQYNSILKSNTVTGELEVKEGGYGFVVLKDKSEGDIFIAERNLGTAFDGDTVEISLFARQKRKNIEGQVIKVVKRKREEFVGELKKSKSFYFLKPDDPAIHRDIYIDRAKLNGAQVGDKVIVGKLCWDSSMLNPEGEVIERIGAAGSQDAEIISMAHE